MEVWLVNNLKRLFKIFHSILVTCACRNILMQSDAVFTFTTWRRGNFLAASKETRRDCAKKPTTRWRSGAQQSQPSLKVSDDFFICFFFSFSWIFENVGEFWSIVSRIVTTFRLAIVYKKCGFLNIRHGHEGQLVSFQHTTSFYCSLYIVWRSILCSVKLNSSFQGMKRQTNWGHLSKSHGHRRLLFFRVIRFFTLANFVFLPRFDSCSLWNSHLEIPFATREYLLCLFHLLSPLNSQILFITRKKVIFKKEANVVWYLSFSSLQRIFLTVVMEAFRRRWNIIAVRRLVRP